MNARSRSAGDKRKHATVALPCRRNKDVGIAGVKLNVVGAGPVVDAEYFRPGFSAVGGLEDAAIAALAPERTLRRHIDHIGVARVNENAPDMLRFLETHVRPAFAP